MHPSVSHPSVRIKGTENNYEPIACIDPECQKAWPHMHCPFCVKTEVFQDPVILKAHYRVKHVDKGIEFAGLKILRCCERCSIVGTIKGTKEFKGAHWHCYRCKNGFTRRDEAIKHYRTHFRNPSTTFQIQVAQDINQSQTSEQELQIKNMESNSTQEMAMIETVITTSAMETDPSQSLIALQPGSPLEVMRVDVPEQEKPTTGEVQVSVAANETVDASEGPAFMIIHDDNSEQAEIIATMEPIAAPVVQPVQHIVKAKPASGQVFVRDANRTYHWRQEKILLENEVQTVKEENARLVAENNQLREHWSAELENVNVQLQMANTEIAGYQKREVELLNQLKVPLDDRINQLLTDLKSQHEELLHHQLAQLRRSYINQLQDELSTPDKSPSQNGDVTEASLGSVIVTGGTNVVISTPAGYAGLTSGSLESESIVLNSEGLMTEVGSTRPIFVMAHSQLPEIKTELKDNLEGSTIIENVLLEDTTSEALAEYSEVHQEVPSTDDGAMTEEILLTTVGDGTTELVLNSDNFEEVTHTETVVFVSDTGKRKLDEMGGTEDVSEMKHIKVLE